MGYLIKALLTDTDTQFYHNQHRADVETAATNISLVNTSGAAVNVTLVFIKKDSIPLLAGAVLFEYPLAAKERLTVGDRLMIPGDTIRAYASVSDVVAMSIDVINEDSFGRYVPEEEPEVLP